MNLFSETNTLARKLSPKYLATKFRSMGKDWKQKIDSNLAEKLKFLKEIENCINRNIQSIQELKKKSRKAYFRNAHIWSEMKTVHCQFPYKPNPKYSMDLVFTIAPIIIEKKKQAIRETHQRYLEFQAVINQIQMKKDKLRNQIYKLLEFEIDKSRNANNIEIYQNKIKNLGEIIIAEIDNVEEELKKALPNMVWE